MTKRFVDKVAVVTGAGSGIGDAVVRRLLDEGARVVAADVSGDALARLQADLPHDRLFIQQCDVAERASCVACVERAQQHAGGIDVLVNSAGITRRNVAPDADFEQAWDRVMEVNLKGSMLMSHAAAQAMQAKQPPGGAIVNIGSIMSSVVYRAEDGLSDGFNPYPHSKGGILQLTRDSAVQLAHSGIRVNAVCPGFIDTQLTESLQDNPQLHASLAQRHALGRFGTAQEVANVIVFLASDEASFVTAAAWSVDGGFLAT